MWTSESADSGGVRHRHTCIHKTGDRCKEVFVQNVNVACRFFLVSDSGLLVALWIYRGCCSPPGVFPGAGVTDTHAQTNRGVAARSKRPFSRCCLLSHDCVGLGGSRSAVVGPYFIFYSTPTTKCASAARCPRSSLYLILTHRHDCRAQYMHIV